MLNFVAVIYSIEKAHQKNQQGEEAHGTDVSFQSRLPERGHRGRLNSPAMMCSVVCQGSCPEPESPGLLPGLVT